MQKKGELEELEKNLKEQRDRMVQENQTHEATADQCKLLKEENDRSDQHISTVQNCLESNVRFFSQSFSVNLESLSFTCVKDIKEDTLLPP